MTETIQEALQRARNLIVQSADKDAVQKKILEIDALSDKDKQKTVAMLYSTAEHEAVLGNTANIALIQLVSEHFRIEPHTRMLLHYYAQAEANRGKKLVQQDITDEEKQHKILEALANLTDILGLLSNISKAFTDADELNILEGEK